MKGTSENMSRMNPGMATCEPDNALESLLLVNTLVEKKRERLSTTRRGSRGRDVHVNLLPYPRFLA
jgi:hypothetical protein